MITCTKCGGAIATPGEVTGWAGKWCACGWSINNTPISPMPIETPKEHMERLDKLISPKTEASQTAVELLLKKRVRELEKKLKWLQADVMAVMEFLIPMTNDRNNDAGAGRIISRVAGEKARIEAIAEYHKSKQFIAQFEEDNPEYGDRNETM
jgi:hypothetical protein